MFDELIGWHHECHYTYACNALFAQTSPLQTKYTSIIGVDEAGRGAWAWPVVAAACRIIDARGFRRVTKIGSLSQINDSKKLSEPTRESLFDELLQLAKQGIIQFSVSLSSNTVIDRYWIREANRRPMGKCIRKLLAWSPHQPIQIDGRDNYRFRWVDPDQVEYIVKGDTKVIQIMMASILAKVHRDRIMRRYDAQFTWYGFAQHKGYGTKIHQDALKTLGACPIHRYSYAPIVALT